MAELYHCYSLFSINFIQYNEVKHMENSQLISVDKLPELLKHDYTFIDLRDPLQFNKIHLRKFINIPYDTFIATPPQFPKDKPIYLICYSGKRSLDLAQKLTRCGYHAYSFNGGFYAVEHPINKQFY